MEPIGPNLVPHASGPLALGVPAPGRLRDLEGCYRLNQRPRPPLRMQRYKWVGEAYGRATHTEMIVLEQVEGLTIPVESTLILMHAFRRAFMSSAEGLGLLVPEIHGHDGAGHCIHMPLPFSGWENADGRILGVAVVLPNSISALNRHAVYRTCASLQHVNVPGLGRLRFSGAGASNRRTLQQQTWKGPSRKWGTVTPMLLKHRPSEKFGRHLPEMVANYCTSAGLPEPIRIQAGRHPFLAGVSRAYDFLLRRKEGEPEEKFAAHALIDFDRPVEGPMLLGKARHFGLGLLRPL